MKDDDGKIIMTCEDDKKEEFEAIFKDDPKITLPVDLKCEKREESKEEKFEEENCHEETMGNPWNDDEMLVGDFSLKANLKNQIINKSVNHNFRRRMKKLKSFSGVM
jgi:3-phosphoglycerate kinase